MTLALYSSPTPDAKLTNSTDISYTPLTFTLSGRRGGYLVKRVYLRNNDNSKYYTNITVIPIDTNTTKNHVDGTLSGWSWRLMEKDFPPEHEEWGSVTAGNTLSLSAELGSSTEGDSATYLSFWVRVEIPSRQLADNIKTVSLRISATETLVGA